MGKEVVTAAERCRRNGWVVGDRLKSWYAGALVTIQITAIGEQSILAKCVETDGISNPDYTDISWCLEYARWRRVR